jgi:hypothetical protein
LSDTAPHDTLPPEPTAADDAATHGYYPELDELPPRPRTRLLTPATVLLMLALFAACGFVGGVLVEKHQVSGSSTVLGGGLASRFGGAGATGASGATGLGGGGFASAFGNSGTRAVGTVADVSGDKLYVTTTTGTLQVDLPSTAKVTKSESVARNSIHPGDSVVITGITASNGTMTASSIADSGTGGITSLFGGSGGAGSGTSTTPSLFGG